MKVFPWATLSPPSRTTLLVVSGFLSMLPSVFLFQPQYPTKTSRIVMSSSKP
ncbi:hypothetical protein I314_05550 [Cryptococcus bacillisporus CA1873]|uniref:Uncharacterized protein n=2 Tax=Cryptococcus gattii TaxID=552467 RepID=A0A0D0UQR5_CRYGA|nr:hypothetical protein I312_00434 [Cryptococcus bacillisporus CA1280]KIR58711.1 hypothetical protein I314_05550 [Cryptococcus bacillisporus CA1873]|eukprot:KIR58711.1 hypothetical protein I314_05550 [Cryptococcus gattii CA1873]